MVTVTMVMRHGIGIDTIQLACVSTAITTTSKVLSTLLRNNTATAPPLGREMRSTRATRQGPGFSGFRGTNIPGERYAGKFGQALSPTKGVVRAAGAHRHVMDAWHTSHQAYHRISCTGRRGDSETGGYLRWMLSSTVVNGTMKPTSALTAITTSCSVFAYQQAKVNQSRGAGTRLACDMRSAHQWGAYRKQRWDGPERSPQAKLHTTSGTNTHHYRRSEQSHRDDYLDCCHSDIRLLCSSLWCKTSRPC